MVTLSFMRSYVDFYSKEAQTSCQNKITKENLHFVMALILTEPYNFGKTVLTNLGFFSFKKPTHYQYVFKGEYEARYEPY